MWFTLLLVGSNKRFYKLRITSFLSQYRLQFTWISIMSNIFETLMLQITVKLSLGHILILLMRLGRKISVHCSSGWSTRGGGACTTFSHTCLSTLHSTSAAHLWPGSEGQGAIHSSPCIAVIVLRMVLSIIYCLISWEIKWTKGEPLPPKDW